jgi:Bacterial SH3 domain
MKRPLWSWLQRRHMRRVTRASKRLALFTFLALLLCSCVFRADWGPFTFYIESAHLPTQEIWATDTTQSTASPMPTAAPTTTATLSPTPIGCTGVVTATTLNIRSGPGVENGVVSTLANGAVVVLLGQHDTGTQGVWYKIAAGWISAAWVQTGCNPPTTPAPIASKLGLHLTVGASQEVVMRALSRLGLLKGTSGTENILQAAHQQRPDLLILYRIVAPDCPPGWGSGDARAVADSWWASRYAAWQKTGLIGVVDYYEVVNECLQPASAWFNAFWIRTFENASMAGICIAAFSDTVGTPEIIEYQFRAPALDWMLTHECQPGRRHVIAHHTYWGVGGGDWLFGRWKMFVKALGQKYEALDWVFTEYSLGDGRQALDCGALWRDWQQANVIYTTDPHVLGGLYFNVSPVGEWSDVSPCF